MNSSTFFHKPTEGHFPRLPDCQRPVQHWFQPMDTTTKGTTGTASLCHFVLISAPKCFPQLLSSSPHLDSLTCSSPAALPAILWWILAAIPIFMICKTAFCRGRKGRSDREIRQPFNPFIKVLEFPISRKQSEIGSIKIEYEIQGILNKWKG